MTSKKPKEEFYSKEETDEFVCGNYFLDEPFFMKDAVNNHPEMPHPHENLQVSYNDIGMAAERALINEHKKDTLHSNEGIKYHMSEIASQADTNFHTKQGKNSKPASSQSHSSHNNNSNGYSNFSGSRLRSQNSFNGNFPNNNSNNNQSFNISSNNFNAQNNQNLLELLISNRLMEDQQPAMEKEKVLGQKKARASESQNHAANKSSGNSSGNSKILNMIVNQISQNNSQNDNYQNTPQGGMLHNDNSKVQNQMNYNHHNNNNAINMQMMESFIMNTNNNPETGENKLLKSLLVNKVNEILMNSNLSEKLILYNMITNSNLAQGNNQNMNKMTDQSINIESNKGFGNFLSMLNKQGNMNPSSINHNSSIKQQNINFNIPSSGNTNTSHFNNVFNNKNDIMEKYINNEVIRCTIENFCKFLFSNGYCIVSNNKLNNNLNQNQFFQNLLQNSFNLEGLNKPTNNPTSNQQSNDMSYSNNFNDADESIKKKTKDILNCPHTDRKHYAKNMCNNCYHKQGRVKKAWLCSHITRPHYARGKCQNCYLNFYHKEQVSKKREKKEQDDIAAVDESNATLQLDEESQVNITAQGGSENHIEGGIKEDYDSEK